MEHTIEKAADIATLNKKLDALIKIGIENNRVISSKFRNGDAYHEGFKKEVEQWIK